MAFKERLKFYADTPLEKNKYCCFQIISLLELEAALGRFIDKGWKIKAAYYERIDLESGEIRENTKLDVAKYLDKYLDSKFKAVKQYRSHKNRDLY